MTTDLLTEKPFKLLKENDEYLSGESFPFDFQKEDPMELFEGLKEIMILNNGLGLAARQVGIPYRAFVMGHSADPDNIVGVFNPTIVDIEGDEAYQEEGCLSFPGLFVEVKRPAIVRCRYTTHEGVTDTIKFDGMTSRVFQHETDHLDGILMTYLATSFHLRRAKKNRKILQRRRKREQQKQETTTT